MNVFKLKNSKHHLSKFNSISQPHLSTLATPPADTAHFKHSERKAHEKQLTESSQDATAKFLDTVKWTAKPCSLATAFNLQQQPDEAPFSDCSNSYSDSDFGYDKNCQLPMLVKVVKGSYGVVREEKGSGGGSKKHVSHLLVYKRVKSVFILCQSMKFKDKKPYVHGKNISIPITYNGWFEILSEDGKSIRPILSIRELAKHALNANNFKKLFNKPKNNISYIVREAITAYAIPSSSLTPMKVRNEPDEQIASNLKLIDCKSVSIRPGDIIQVVGQIYILHSSSSCSYSSKAGICKRVKMFKCLVRRKPASNNYDPANTSVHTETLFLPEEAQGKYSPVARIENISGVHKLDDLVKKFRFPVTVQLVYGRAPSSATGELKNPLASSFSPILKLLKIYEEDNVLAYPIGRESCFIQIPLRAKLNVVRAQNIRSLISESMYLRIILSECKLLAPEYSDMIYNLPETPPQSVIGVDVLNTGMIQSCVKNLIGRTGAAVVERSFNQELKESSQASLNARKLQERALNTSVECEGRNNKGNGGGERENADDGNSQIYKEIDDLYEYVRTGVLPEYLESEANGVKASVNTHDRTKPSSPVNLQKLARNQSFNSTNNSYQTKPLMKEPSSHHHHCHLPKATKTTEAHAIETKPKIPPRHLHHIYKSAHKDHSFCNQHSHSHDESTFQNMPTTPNKRVNFANLIDQYGRHLMPHVNLAASQEMFVKKSSSYQQVLAGGMSASYYYQQGADSPCNELPVDEMLYDMGSSKSGERKEKEWFEAIQRLSFNLKKMDSSPQRERKRQPAPTAVAVDTFEKFLMKTKQIGSSENFEVNAKKPGELRNYLSMERLHEIFLNENFDSAILQQGQHQQHEAMQHHCFL